VPGAIARKPLAWNVVDAPKLKVGDVSVVMSTAGSVT